MLFSIINDHPHTTLQGTIAAWVQFLIRQQHKFWVLQTLNLGFWNLEFGIADQGTLTTFGIEIVLVDEVLDFWSYLDLDE